MFSKVKNIYYFQANDNLNIRKIFKPLFIILSLFGLLPYCIKLDSKRGLRIIKKTIFINSLCALSYILLFSLFLALHIRNVYYSIGESSMTREVMTQLNYILELIVSFTFCLSAYICVYTNRYTFVKIINDIANSMDLQNPYMRHFINNFRFKVNVIIMSLLFLIFMLQVCVNFTRQDPFWKMILVFITFILPQVLQFTLLCFYYVLISMLMLLLIYIKIQISNLIVNKIHIIDSYWQEDGRIIKLQHIETLYVKAFEIKKAINKAFQALILITSMQSFHTMISEAHIIYHGLVIENDFPTHPLVNCSLWIIYQIIKIYILARTGTVLKQEVMNIGQVLHNIPTDKHDIRLLLEIQHFSSLMSHQNHEITAYGFFQLDATLLSKIISSAAMYLIILVQFDRK